MRFPFANFAHSDGKNNSGGASANGQSEPQHPPQVKPTIAFYVWIVICTVALAGNGYLSCQLQIQTNNQQGQVENLVDQLNNLAAVVDHIVASKAGITLSRHKRHSSAAKPLSKEHVKLGRVFRWIASNWTDPVEAEEGPSKRRRQVESIPDVGNGNKQPAVDFYPRPQPIDQTSRDYEWLTSYCRISVSGLLCSTIYETFDSFGYG